MSPDIDALKTVSHRNRSVLSPCLCMADMDPHDIAGRKDGDMLSETAALLHMSDRRNEEAGP